MNKRALLVSGLIAVLVGGVACDDEPAPGTDMLGGHWVGESAAVFGPESLAVGITTDDGEMRIISYFAEEPDVAAEIFVPPLSFQIVADASASGSPSESLIEFLSVELGFADAADVLQKGLSGNVKVYVPIDFFDTPAGVPPEGGPPVFPTAAIVCSSAGAGEGECNYDGGIGEGVALAGVVTADITDAAPEAPAVVEPIAFHIGEYSADTYEVPSSLAELEGGWSSVTGPAGMGIEADGTIDGGDIASCSYSGSFSIIDAALNAYRMSLVVANCGEFNGSYSGLASVLPGDVFGGGPGEVPAALEGDVMLFQVDNGEFLISDVLVYQGIPD